MSDDSALNLLDLTVDIVAAHVAHNIVAAEALPDLIARVHAALAGLGQAPPAEPEFVPAVPVRSSVKADYIVSLIDGRRYRTLKRHLANHGLTPQAYRERYGLAADYPMVASAYAEKRRQIAKALGLGRKPKAPAVPVDPA
jgi:predicted transcriptional regulator